MKSCAVQSGVLCTQRAEHGAPRFTSASLRVTRSPVKHNHKYAAGFNSTFSLKSFDVASANLNFLSETVNSGFF